MGLVYQTLLSVILLLLSVTVLASESSKEIQYNVVVTRDISVNGDRICHDGRYIYYKSKQDCLEDGQKASCLESKIAPINQVERILLADQAFVTSFYKVILSYMHRTFTVNKEGRTVENERKTKMVQTCENRQTLKPINVLQERWAVQEEYPYLYVLLKNNMAVINSPMGEIRSLRVVNLKNHNLDKLSVFAKINLKSPHCEKNPLFIDYVLKLGGEYSGNGWRHANMKYLQSSSSEIKFSVPLKSEDDLNSILESKIYCVNTVDI